MTFPRATARLQLHPAFTLEDACAQVPYYAGLGISHLYLSPISRARPGSMHGYDVVDHAQINPELGGRAALLNLAHRAREQGMGLILDIVPNHMATDPANAWWWDVLRYGANSAYASWLDIDWNSSHPGLRGKVLAPFLDRPYGLALAGGAIRLVFDDASKLFHVEACGRRYPLAPDTWGQGLRDGGNVAALYDAGTPGGQRNLHALLERQHYRLAWWRYAAGCRNWRRFFDIGDLIGVRVERPPVFDAVHALPLRLFAEGLVDGLRIDHIDGLADPAAYCRTLRARLGERSAQRPGSLSGDAPWLIVEKILADGETLDARWPVDGTTGYDFMDQATAVLHDPEAETALTQHWEAVARDDRPPVDWLHDARQLMLDRYFTAERDALLGILSQLAQTSTYTRDWTKKAIGHALDRLLIMFPVYRTYGDAMGRGAADIRVFAETLERVRGRLDREPGGEHPPPGMLESWLYGGADEGGRFGPNDDLHAEAMRRFQQLTPPLAAKSLEDTVFYRYGRLLSRNEVGSDPAVFALSPGAFHRHNGWRATYAAQSMLATATHDHKRGEDVRTRLAVLSEMPLSWQQASGRWLQWCADEIAGNPVRAAEFYMLFQMLVGAWPLDLAGDDGQGLERYLERIAQWQVKALREAKLNSSWTDPRVDYERARTDFIHGLAVGGPAGLLDDVALFVRRIAPAGAVNSLAQTVLRVTVPGVPDLYQGAEFWDFSLVDPDNRRPVDVDARRQALAALHRDTDMSALLAGWRNGHVKQAVLARALRLRRDIPDVFMRGRYFSLPVLGPRATHVLAFVRCWRNCRVFVVVPRLCSSGIDARRSDARPVIDPAFWGETELVLPRQCEGATLTDALSGAVHRCGPDGVLRLADLLAELPVSLLVAR